MYKSDMRASESVSRRCCEHMRSDTDENGEKVGAAVA